MPANAPISSSEPMLERLAGPAVVLLAAALAIAPQLIRGNTCGHDFDFHLVSWFDCFTAWRHGIFYPHWAPSPNYGAGEPRFLFYPPLTWMLGAALALFLPWPLVPIALTFILLAATGLATRALARRMLAPAAATLAGCTAIFSGYALFTAYERSAFAELSGGFWIPLLLLLALGPIPTRFAQDIFSRATALLALVVAGAWLSNAPVGVMASYLLAAVALAYAILCRSWIPVVRAAVATALGLALSAFYLLPAAFEQRWVDIRQATEDPGEAIENSFLFGHHAEPLLHIHNVELQRISILGVSMIAVALLSSLVCFLRHRHSLRAMPSCIVPSPPGPGLSGPGLSGPDLSGPGSSTLAAPCPSQLGTWESTTLVTDSVPGPSGLQARASNPLVPVLVLIPIAVLILQLPVSLFVWNLLPKLRYLQFPWRWLVVVEAPMAILFAAAVWPRIAASRASRIAVPAICASLFIAATTIAATTFFQPCDSEDAVLPMLQADLNGTGFQGTDEYAPIDADNSLVADGLPDACLVTDPDTTLGISAAEGENPNWQIEQHTCDAVYSATAKPGSGNPAAMDLAHFHLHADVPHAGYLILRLRSYQAWHIRLNGNDAGPLNQRDDGLIELAVPHGPIDLAADWTTTPDVKAARTISAVALTFFIALVLFARRPTVAA